MKIRPEFDKCIIGKNLRRYRIQRNLSVEEVREYLQLGSQQAIYKWEEGQCYPQADTLLALMQLYEIEVNNLICEDSQSDTENVMNSQIVIDELNLQRQMRIVKEYYFLVS